MKFASVVHSRWVVVGTLGGCECSCDGNNDLPGRYGAIEFVVVVA